jgi:hypothetical protein
MGYISESEWRSTALSQLVDSMSDPDVNFCGCGGSGWIHTDFDTFHECRYHYWNQHHPEDFEDFEAEPTEEWVLTDDQREEIEQLSIFHAEESMNWMENLTKYGCFREGFRQAFALALKMNAENTLKP